MEKKTISNYCDVKTSFVSLKGNYLNGVIYGPINAHIQEN